LEDGETLTTLIGLLPPSLDILGALALLYFLAGLLLHLLAGLPFFRASSFFLLAVQLERETNLP
jgi:hypothetical protein